MASDHFKWNEDDARTKFAEALSAMYAQEVPLYQDLVSIVRDVDQSVLASSKHPVQHIEPRHQIERHGAIRLGTEQELRSISRLFALFGMHPVGYYDLTAVGFPLHATAFRPISEESLAHNPFRVFTTLLRLDMVPEALRRKAENVLQQRRLFSPRLLQLIDRAETGSLTTNKGFAELLEEALHIFRWQSRSTVTYDEYRALKSEHPIIADIVCFPSAHINHLTPRTLDIDAVQSEMVQRGLPAKERIEGPPVRTCPILLRQTSFKALDERVVFESTAAAGVTGTHTARFGEVEQRGAALTRKGRKLYDQLLAQATQEAETSGTCFDAAVHSAFKAFPDTWSQLREQGLIFVRYKVATSGARAASNKFPSGECLEIDDLLASKLVEFEPLTYEDFLPLSAAGIFRSNLTGVAINSQQQVDDDHRREFELALGRQPLDEFGLYAALQQESIDRCAEALGVAGIVA
ncbi:uncharacterized protein HMPREF1541_03544 [Cyphellophora europaea CBS 101466]|uniref:2-oxoadipate dioxygenase/decarboxylase n=1 Tax=Cyphellophora europaea (strain CBS 101466) TaxID=1220924 RepID=W2S0N7_CYPE1|nr:uncharacterized protein HMPREF1541_03544 [Cyphellophora europaea CBS 101466]ETN41608.1 hypothetical protein HMPREF1541_03544 [Cyphellophora europaea CBS 101466]